MGRPSWVRGQGNGGYLWTFDPSVVSDPDGSQWIFYGSYNGGVFVAPLDDSGTQGHWTRDDGRHRQQVRGRLRRAARPAYWYLFASTANCCAGPTTGYSVQVGRSRDLRGPYVDQQGVPLTTSRAGGTPVLTQNGNRWVGAGHNAIAQDVTGQDWIVYHAIDRGDPFLDGTSGINQRPMLMDRLDWVHGWPAVRGGRGPSAASTAGSGDVELASHSSADAAAVLTRAPLRGPVRVEADLRGRSALAARWQGARHGVRAVVRPGAHDSRWWRTRGGRRVVRSGAAARGHRPLRPALGRRSSCAVTGPWPSSARPGSGIR